MILNNMHLKKPITVSIIEVQKNILQVALKEKVSKSKTIESQKLLTLFMPRAQHCTT